MKKILAALLVFYCCNAGAQNLVINPSFEDTISCVIYSNQGPPITQCPPWFLPTLGSTDYFSPTYSCNTSLWSVPSNYFGFQYARTGAAYMGLVVDESIYFFPEYREYIEGILIDTLQQGHQYCVNFYVVAADRCRYVTDGMGAYFSNDSIFNQSTDTVLSSFIPQISNPNNNILSDTLNWTLISGMYLAQGGEKYITIGNFKTDVNTNIDSLNNNAPGGNYISYYYIDDVSVIDCTVGLNEITNSNTLSFSPNPVKQNLSFTYNLKNKTNCTLQIYNVLGQKVFAAPLNANAAQQKINVAFLNTGVYYCRLFADGEVVGAGMFVKE